MIELSVIIVSYNTKKLLESCLRSVFASLETAELSEESEVMVIDNASSDGSTEMVQDIFPKIKLIKNNKNLGFGQANNLGLIKAKGKYLLLLNSDTILYEDSINNSLKEIKNNQEIGVLGCKILNSDLTLQQSSGYFPSLMRIFFWVTFIDQLPLIKKIVKPYHQKNKDFYNQNQNVDWVTGAFFLINREVVTTVGYFDPKVFMYVEEIEYCYRIKKQGWKILYTPKAKIIHKKGASGQGINAGIIDEFLGVEYFYQKHSNSIALFLVRAMLYIGALLRVILFGIINKSGDKQKIYLQYLKMA